MKKSIIIASISILFFAVSANAQSYTFNNDLGLGSTGSDVSNLQTWLMSNGYNIPSISSGVASRGYFGSQTQAAVEAYQRTIGLPAYGFFGPLTRGYWSGHYGNGGNSGGNPGTSLRVTSPNGGETWQLGTMQNITWTNGTASAGYNQTGDIKLEFFTPACAQPGANPQCGIAVRAPLTIASGVNLNSASYVWNVGQLSNYCAGNVACPVTAIPLSAGQYKIQICPTNVNSNLQCDDSDNYFNITSSNVSNGQTPVISGIDAPTSLALNQTGTWTVHATDPLNGTLSYSVNWGDSAYPVAAYSTSAALSYGQSTTFTHSYSNAGTYTIAFTVRNSSSLQAQTTTTIVVGNSNTVGSLRVISPNGGEVWARGTNQSITWTSPYYSNGMTADLKIVPYQAPCPAGSMCPMYMLAPYTIATNIPINQNSYSWNVGTAYSPLVGTYNCPMIPAGSTNSSCGNSVTTIPDGQYTVQICQSGTSNCDSSDSTFTISN